MPKLRQRKQKNLWGFIYLFDHHRKCQTSKEGLIISPLPGWVEEHPLCPLPLPEHAVAQRGSQHLAGSKSISFLLREKQRESNLRDTVPEQRLYSKGEKDTFFSLIVWKLSLKVSQVYPASVCLVMLLCLVAFLLFPLCWCNSL